MYEQSVPQRRSEERSTISLADVVETIGAHWIRYLALGLFAIVLVNVVAIARQPEEPLYHAEALVVATTLEIRVDSLPRTASAIFNGGSVARLAAEVAATGIDPDDLIPDIVTVQPVENTTVVEVDALHPDPELAALYANAAGRALAEEMNRIGPGLGTFELGFEATPPNDPEDQSILPYLVFSPVAALMLVLGTAVLVAFVRQQKGRLLAQLSTLPAEDAPKGADIPPPTRTEPAATAIRRPSTKPSKATASPAPETGAEEQPAQIPIDVPAPPESPGLSGIDAASDGMDATATADSNGPLRPGVKPGIDLSLDEFTSFRTDVIGNETNADGLPEIEPFVKPLDRIKRPSPVHPLSASGEQAQELIDTITGIGPVYGGRLAVLGITRAHQLAAANPKWVASAVEVPEEVVIDWIRQAVGFSARDRARKEP